MAHDKDSLKQTRSMLRKIIQDSNDLREIVIIATMLQIYTEKTDPSVDVPRRQDGVPRLRFFEACWLPRW